MICLVLCAMEKGKGLNIPLNQYFIQDICRVKSLGKRMQNLSKAPLSPSAERHFEVELFFFEDEIIHRLLKPLLALHRSSNCTPR